MEAAKLFLYDSKKVQVIVEVLYNINSYCDDKEETAMSVLAVPIKRSLDVSSDFKYLFIVADHYKNDVMCAIIYFV